MNENEIKLKTDEGKQVRKSTLARWCAVLSVFTLLAYHWQFFCYLFENIESDVNGVMISVGTAVLLLSFNYFYYYLLAFCGRFVGKCILAFLFIANAISLYFINTYQVLITSDMMGNVYNTKYAEASAFFSWQAVLYLLLLGVVPCLYIFGRKVDYGNVKQFLKNIGISLGISIFVALVNMPNWTWVDRHVPTLGSLILPWSYTVNTFRYYNDVREQNRQAILLPDATIKTESKDVCVLIIGESARRENFSLYGYNRCTNPLLERDSVTALMAEAATTYTTGSVKAILDHKPTDDLYEILPNYLFRSGVDVEWRTSNWGEPPVHIDKYYNEDDLRNRYSDEDDQHDGILFAGLKEAIASCDKDKMLIILHTYTSHGPSYYKNYPAEFEVFTPSCKTVEMSKANPQELMNAYDNTIVYTDYLVHSVIETLKAIPERRSCMIFVSDHGESLGEKNLYMHGVPMAIAPKEQVEIPFLVWTSDKTLEIDTERAVGHYNVFHSIISFLGIDSPVYDAGKDIFNYKVPQNTR